MNDGYFSNPKKNIYLFFIIPLLLNLVLVGAYISGIAGLQHIISPNNGFLTREAGLLEQLENLYLLVAFFMFLFLVFKRTTLIEKAFFAVLSVLFLFLFLEEIDYGLNLYEFIIGEHIEGVRNWHNESADGEKQNVHYFKQLIDGANLLWFVILPLVASKIKTPLITCLVPHRFFIAAFLLTVVYSKLTHGLDDMGLHIIDGVQGSLTSNISEFREHNTYYLYLLYALQVVNTRLTLSFK